MSELSRSTCNETKGGAEVSGWVYFVFVVLGVFGTPSVSVEGKGYGAWVGALAWACWTIVMLALLAAIVVGDLGWPP